MASVQFLHFVLSCSTASPGPFATYEKPLGKSFCFRGHGHCRKKIVQTSSDFFIIYIQKCRNIHFALSTLFRWNIKRQSINCRKSYWIWNVNFFSASYIQSRSFNTIYYLGEFWKNKNLNRSQQFWQIVTVVDSEFLFFSKLGL